MEKYLKVSEIIDWQHPEIMERAQKIASGFENSTAIAKACFEWVRDEIYHSYDYQMNPVTCRASDVLQRKDSGQGLTETKKRLTGQTHQKLY
jgi:transglutaminase-like putative cysteine protease